MITFRNILAVIVGLVVFLICDLLVPTLLILIAKIPILGYCITFFAPDPISIIAIYSVWIVAGATLFSANAIAAKNSSGHKIGMFVLSVLLIPLYIIQANSIFKAGGFSYSLIIYLLAAVGSVSLCFSMGKGDE